MENGTRKLLEITCGKPENSRFVVCYWMNGDWWFDDNEKISTIERRGYRLLTIHDLPLRTIEKKKDNIKDQICKTSLRDVKKRLKGLKYCSEFTKQETLLQIVDNLIDIINDQKAKIKNLYKLDLIHLKHNLKLKRFKNNLLTKTKIVSYPE